MFGVELPQKHVEWHQDTPSTDSTSCMAQDSVRNTRLDAGKLSVSTAAVRIRSSLSATPGFTHHRGHVAEQGIDESDKLICCSYCRNDANAPGSVVRESTKHTLHTCCDKERCTRNYPPQYISHRKRKKIFVHGVRGCVVNAFGRLGGVTIAFPNCLLQQRASARIRKCTPGYASTFWQANVIYLHSNPLSAARVGTTRR